MFSITLVVISPESVNIMNSGEVKGIIVQNGHKSMKLGIIVADHIINDFYLHT